MLKKKMLMFLFRNKKTQKWRYNPSGYISASSRTMLETANWDIFIKKSSKYEREWTLECPKVDLQLSSRKTFAFRYQEFGTKWEKTVISIQNRCTHAFFVIFATSFR